MDFVKAATRSVKNSIEVYPKFVVCPTKDLMIRAGDFYGMWLEDENRWTIDEDDVIATIDRMLKEKADEIGTSNVAWMWDGDSKSIDKWHYYCKHQQHDRWEMLDNHLVFADEEVRKEDYVTKKLPYRIEPGDISAYDELISTIYSPQERHKIEWMIGSIFAGDSRKIEKFYVFYGEPGSGKSTVLKIIKQLFPGYCAGFSAAALGDKNNQFAFAQFKDNPLIAIDTDCNLSRIDENARLNALISHEDILVNEKQKAAYVASFQSVLICASNKPVKITDSKSGLLRRLIDINPSGNKILKSRYMKLTSDIKFELGAIAAHCLSVYTADPSMYDDYVPQEMMALTNDFYDFMIEHYFEFEKKDETTLANAYDLYKSYCEASSVIPMRKKEFKSELRSYFSEYFERIDDKWNLYRGFLKNKFKNSSDTIKSSKPKVEEKPWLIFTDQKSLFDSEFKDCPAQLTNDQGTPLYKWDNVKTKLSDVDTSKLHYVKVPENHIVIDFDITGDDGEKSFEKSFAEAIKFPPTYAELSKSGKGIHLHYIYNGDVTKLSHIYDDQIEIKVFTGNSSLRRKLSKCNDIPIKPISCSLPVKGDTGVLQTKELQNEKHLRCLIRKCLNKEYGSTVCCVDFIDKLLLDAYNQQGFSYDVSELAPSIYAFCANSTHQSLKCIKTYSHMKFKSKDFEEANISKGPEKSNDDRPIVFFDIEVFPNLFMICWKEPGKENPCHKMINPEPSMVERFVRDYRIIGFNNRKYDNHMLYARILGYTEKEIFELSNRMINLKSRNSNFGPAYNLSYTDIYDFASAANKMSLKKWEIKLGIKHMELGLPWNKPVETLMWNKVAEYCCNDVIATEAVFNALKEDWVARQILAKLAGMSCNDTTNALTIKFIFQGNKNPQSSFNYRKMGEVPSDAENFVIAKDGTIYKDVGDPEFTLFDKAGRPVFPGYTFEFGHSFYRGEDPKEGGYVYAEPGIYYMVALLDIASMHPSSIIAEELFGPEYTKRYADIRQARIYIKHGEFDKASKMLDGALAEFLTDPEAAKGLANALKTALNSVYGLTSASFTNECRDPRNVDNIVAKRGALFMINLKHEVQKRGYTVAHIKTDSIKIPNATDEIIQFVMDYGKMYGYNFEHEATYEKMCLVNNAVYIAKYSMDDVNGKHKGKWTATGTEFQTPYIFKTLFSKEPIEFNDMTETKTSTTGDIFIETDTTRQFIGKVGQFCPMKDVDEAGALVHEVAGKTDGSVKYDSLSGSIGYKWMEAEDVIAKGLQDKVDKSYYINAANKAIDHIKEFGDYEAFVA